MDSCDQSSHGMITRSKSKGKEAIFYEFDEGSDFSDDYDDSDNSDDNSEVDSEMESDDNSEVDSEEDQDFGDDDFNDGSDVDRHGNIKGLIDYKCKAKFDQDEFQRQLSILGSGGRMRSHSSPKKKRNAFSRKKKGSKKHLNDVLLSYLIMKATDKANEELKSRARKKKKDKIQLDEEESEDTSDSKVLIVKLKNDLALNEKGKENEEEDVEEDTSDNESFVSAQDIDDSETSTDVSLASDEKSEDISEDTSDEEYLFEYDDLDTKYEELVEKQTNLNSEEANMEFFHYLSKEKKIQLTEMTEEIYKIQEKSVPLRFKVIESDMEMKTKAIAIENIDKLAGMDVSTGEHSKMDHWVTGLIRIPFGKYEQLPVLPDSSLEEKQSFIKETSQILNSAIYGHKEAKTHILQVIGKWIKNPDSGGNVLAIQGPMGNGKTTLVKDGISKALKRPFAFIALGGASDSAYFDGHSYTYEGSHWGRIVQILHDSKCMNPVIYFDELDKVSETPKGEEIIHMLTHLTDPSQNALFQDNYFPGVNLDLSKALFIFSYNDESRVNKILKDRMYVIHTKGFNAEDKLKISREYLLPEIYKTYDFTEEDIVFSDSIIQKIIQGYTGNEEGVRNLKRCFETIISKINIHILSAGQTGELSFKLKQVDLPMTLTEDNIEVLLKIGVNDRPPFHMYV